MIDIKDMLPLITLLGFIITIASFYNTLKKAERQRAEKETEHHVEQRTLLRGVDDKMMIVSKDVDKISDKLDITSERLTRVEESAKQAHLRINKIEDKGC